MKELLEQKTGGKVTVSSTKTGYEYYLLKINHSLYYSIEKYSDKAFMLTKHDNPKAIVVRNIIDLFSLLPKRKIKLL